MPRSVNRPAPSQTGPWLILAALMLLPALLAVDANALASPAGLAAAIYLGICPTALGYALFSRGLRLTSAAAAVTLSLAEPLTAGLLGVLLLGESLAPLAWLGIGLLFAGLALLAL